jgi:hypothetical protein
VKPVFSLIVFVFSLSECGHALAQFKQPPPDRLPPVCSHQNRSSIMPPDRVSDADCPGKGSVTEVRLTCSSSDALVRCFARIYQLDKFERWTVLDPGKQVYDWAFIVDNQEYYLSPSSDDAISFNCGYLSKTYVRVTAAFVTDVIAYECPLSISEPVDEPGMEKMY